LWEKQKLWKKDISSKNFLNIKIPILYTFNCPKDRSVQSKKPSHNLKNKYKNSCFIFLNCPKKLKVCNPIKFLLYNLKSKKNLLHHTHILDRNYNNIIIFKIKSKLNIIKILFY